MITKRQCPPNTKSVRAKIIAAVELISDVLPFVWRKCEQIHEAGLVEIAHRGFAVWQNPFGMLSPDVRDCIGYSHDHCSFIPSNRSSRSERLWRVTH